MSTSTLALVTRCQVCGGPATDAVCSLCAPVIPADSHLDQPDRFAHLRDEQGLHRHGPYVVVSLPACREPRWEETHRDDVIGYAADERTAAVAMLRLTADALPGETFGIAPTAAVPHLATLEPVP